MSPKSSANALSPRKLQRRNISRSNTMCWSTAGNTAIMCAAMCCRSSTVGRRRGRLPPIRSLSTGVRPGPVGPVSSCCVIATGRPSASAIGSKIRYAPNCPSRIQHGSGGAKLRRRSAERKPSCRCALSISRTQAFEQSPPSKEHLHCELQLPARCCRGARNDASRAGESSAHVIELGLRARGISEVRVVGGVESLRLELQSDALRDPLVLHHASCPEDHSGAVEGVATAGPEARSAESGAVGIRCRKSKAGKIDIIHCVAFGAVPVVDDTIREVEGLRAQQSERIASDNRRKWNPGAQAQEVIEGPVAQD